MSKPPVSEATKKKMSASWDRDKHITPERNANLSRSLQARKARLGYVNSPEARKKVSESRKGIKLSEETKEKIRQANLGKKYPNRNHKRLIGPAKPAWKGGVTSIAMKIRNSKEYAVWRLSVFERDLFRCQMPGCGVMGNMQANHIKTFSKYPELRLDVGNGITLCVPCHRSIKAKESEYESLFFAIVALKINYQSPYTR